MYKKLLIILFFVLWAIPAFADVDTAWVRWHNPTVNTHDAAFAIAIDGSGNVYVTGGSYGSGTDCDYATIKYDSSGNQLWVRRYNGSVNGHDWANDIVVDDFGNVYVTGYSLGKGTSSDCVTIKYDANGNELWVKRYNGPGNGYEWSNAVALDDSNNVYVTGEGYVTIKYTQTHDTQD